MERKNQKSNISIVLTLFAFLATISFLIYFGRIIYLSFTDSNRLKKPNFIGISNYSFIARDDICYSD